MKMEQRFVQRADLRQQQKQILSPRIIQSIEVLQLGTQELEKLVAKELVENPALMLERTKAEDFGDGMSIDPHGQGDRASSDQLERDIEFLERHGSATFDDFSPRAASRAAALNQDEDPKQEALANAPDRGESLQDFLLGQLHVIEMDDGVRDACERIIEALDDNGHLPLPLEEVIPLTNGYAATEAAQEALRIVQSLEPSGVGARNTAESLLLQIDPEDMDFALYRAVLVDHWDDLLRNKLPKIAKETGYTIDDIKFAIEQISTLNPYPGRSFSSSRAQAVTPDIVIEEPEDSPGEFRVRMVNDHLPRIRVSTRYRRLLEQAKDKATRDYLKQKIENARALIEAMQQRQSTLERVALVLLERQHDFMELGVSGLKPLKMQEVADELKVHVSTVCRAVAEKYVETPQGVYPLKFFFVGGTETVDGEDTSRNAVKELLKKLVDEEDKASPLSDIAIAKMLTDESGIKIARRTVAKYRDQLNIPDSRQRRAY